MSNVLEHDKQQQVLALGRLGWSLRRIEEATGIRRETASSYLKAAAIAVRERGGRPRVWPPPNPATTPEVSTDSVAADPVTVPDIATDTPSANPATTPEVSTERRQLDLPPALILPVCYRVSIVASRSALPRHAAGRHDVRDQCDGATRAGSGVS